MSSRKRPLQLVLGLLLGGCVLLAAGILFVRRDSGSPYRFHGTSYSDSKPGNDFELAGDKGGAVRLSDFAGKVILLEFGFTHCPNICPMALANIAALYRRMTPEERDRVQVLFVTVDPSRDTVQVLRDYVPFFHESFIGLTGTPEQIEAVKKEYGVYSKEVPLPGKDGDYTVDHSAYLYVLDPLQRLRVTYDHTRLGESEPILKDIRHLLGETP